MHKAASEEVSDYLIQAQYLIHPDLAKQPIYLADEGWKQEMIRQQATGGRRGRKKRTLSEYQQGTSWTNKTSLLQESDARVATEDQEPILAHLRIRHGGNVGEAELSMRVHLQYGQGEKKQINLLFCPWWKVCTQLINEPAFSFKSKEMLAQEATRK